MSYNSPTLPPASRRADYDVTIEMTDENDIPLDLEGVEITVQINPMIAGYGNPGDALGGAASAYLVGTIADGGVMVVGPGVFNILFPAERMRGMQPGTYAIGVIAERDGMTEQFFAGTVAILEGVVGGGL